MKGGAHYFFDMATIKGQNLRLLVDSGSGTPVTVALSSSCSVHIAANVEDVSTKDSEGGWIENAVTGLSWDLSTEALVSLDGTSWSKTLETETQMELEFDIGISDYYVCLQAVYMEENVSYEFGTMASDEHIFIVDSNFMGVEQVENGQTWGPSVAGTHSGYYYVATKEPSVVTISRQDARGTDTPSLIGLMEDKVPVRVEVALTEGMENSDVQDRLYFGEALITDINISAANRQNGTASVQLTGVGELNEY